MIFLTTLFGLYVLASGYYFTHIERENRAEREALEDRLMAITRPEALITHKALVDSEPADVTYMDEAKEYAAGNGNVDLLGDD